MIRVACVGITVMDRIYYVEGLPTESGKYVARNYTEVGGGPAATAAVAAARLGAQVDFIGRVGDDDTGNSLLAELESWGVNTRYTKRYNQAKSSQSAIMVDTKGERIIKQYLSRMNKVWFNQKLNDAIADGSNDSCFWTIPVSNQTDYKHRKKCDASSVWKRCKLKH